MAEEAAGPPVSWRTRAKVAAVFALTGGVLLLVTGFVPGFTPISKAPSEGHPAVGVLAGFTLGGICFVAGWRQFRDVQLFLETPTSTVRSLAVGAAEIHGEARPVDEPLQAPVSGREACLYELEVEEPSPGEGSSRRTRLDVRDHTPFVVDDGTGAVRVDPREADLVLETEEEVEVKAGDNPPGRVVEWVREGRHREGEVLGGDGDGPAPEEVADELTSARDDRRWLTERILDPGETTYVWGGAERREGVEAPENERNLVMREHDRTGAFYVSEHPQEEVAERMILGTAVYLSVGTVSIVLAVVATLEWIGVF